MTSTKIWMPLYIADYLADTTRLTTEQHGAYLLLIMDYWRNGPLPDDDHALSNITRLAPPAWKKHRAALSRMFQIEGCEWRHKRIDEELAEAKSNAEKYAERAKKAAAKRWGKDTTSNATGNASSIPQAMPDECTTPSPTPVISEPKGSENKPGKRAALDKPEGITQEVWDGFLAIRKAKKAPLTAAALEGIKREATKAGIDLQEALMVCCTRGWQGFNAEWMNGAQASAGKAPARTSRHSGFEKINYREGINADGTFA